METGGTDDLTVLERELNASALAQMHPLVKAWRGDQIDADIGETTAALVALISDEAAARGFAAIMKVLALPPEPFKARLVEIDGHRFLAQIDFTDPSAELPFVAVARATTPPGAIADAGVLRRLAAEFAVFAPRRVQFYHSAHVPLAMPGTYVDRHFLAAPASEMAARAPAPGLTRVALRRPADLRFYPRYAEAYDQMFLERPQLRGDIRVEREESLARCQAEGSLYEIEVDGAWAGIVAARRQVLADLRGVDMTEIVLCRRARGQGLGPAVHQRFAAEIAAADPAAILTGTISPLNGPSLKAASRAGRVEIGAWYWLDV